MKTILDSIPLDRPIFTQDGETITCAEFYVLAERVAHWIDKEFPAAESIGVRSDNSLHGLTLVAGVCFSGRIAVPLATFTEGPVNDYVVGIVKPGGFVGFGTKLDHSDPSWKNALSHHEYLADQIGGIVSQSSGSTGVPKISLINVFQIPEDHLLEQRTLLEELTGEQEQRSFYTPPVMVATSVYFDQISMGLHVFFTNKRVQTGSMLDLINENDIRMVSARATMLEKMAREGVDNFGAARVIMTSGAPINQEHIDIANSLGIDKIVDFYGTTEAGLIGLRVAGDGVPFSIFPGNEISDVRESGYRITSPAIMGAWVDGKLHLSHSAVVDDTIERDGDGRIKSISRAVKKIRVSGFSAPAEIVKAVALSKNGVDDCHVRVIPSDGSSAHIRLLYTGTETNSEELEAYMSSKLPFYAVPKSYLYVSVEDWGLQK